jgi:dihydroneopterin aldolase
MTQLLISVKNCEEAKLVAGLGVDIVDLKDPNNGALGALSIDLTQQILCLLDATTSATVGENHPSFNSLLDAIKLRAELGVDIIKIAISDFFYDENFVAEMRLHTQKTKIVAVFFADSAIDLTLIDVLQAAGFYGAMLDTQQKQLDLFGLLTKQALQKFVHLCAKHSLISGLAGSLKQQYIDELIKINPTYIGFRGGLCENNQRNADLSHEKVLNTVTKLHKHNKLSAKGQKTLSLALHN